MGSAVSIFEHLKYAYTSFLSGTPQKINADKIETMAAILEILDIEFHEFSFEVFVKSILKERAFDNYHWDLQLNCISDDNYGIMMD